MTYHNVLTTCPYCGAGCGIYLQVMDGRIQGVLPAKQHPISEGNLCVKGWNAAGFVYHPDRLTKPQIREGDGYLFKGEFSLETDPEDTWVRKMTYRYEAPEQAEKDIADWADLDIIVLRLKPKVVLKVM